MAVLSDKEVLAVLHYREAGLSFTKIARHVQRSEEAVRRVLRDIDTPRIQRLLFARDGNRQHDDDTQDDDADTRLTSGQQQSQTQVKKTKNDPEISEYEVKRLQRMRENQATLIALGIEKLVVKQKRVKRELSPEEKEMRKNPRRSKRRAIADGTAAGEFEFVQLVEFRRRSDPTKPGERKAKVGEMQAPTTQNVLFYVDAESFRSSRWLGNEDELLDTTEEYDSPLSTSDASPAKKEETNVEPPQAQQNGIRLNDSIVYQRAPREKCVKQKREVVLGDQRRSIRTAALKDETIEVKFEQLQTEKLLRRELNAANQVRMKIKQIEINVDRFHSQWLGKTFSAENGLIAVMNAACPDVNLDFQNRHGHYKWKNALVLMWVLPNSESIQQVVQNIKRGGGEDGGAVCFRWVATRHTALLPGSDFINRLIRTTKGHENLRVNDETYYNPEVLAPLKEEKTDAKQSDPVLFLIRDTSGAHIYCGRLGYLGYRPDSNPLEFRWQLLDHAAIDWEKIQTPA
uniref:Uncharacterized protein n=1 Tax=Globisporangium ultimum (strain ATCC 200006 / CBS 805.95 / DAOM BR144) TaxID=431595 RepID=K3X6S5_GLOUD